MKKNGGVQKHETSQSDDLAERKRAKPTCLDDSPEWDYIKNSKSCLDSKSQSYFKRKYIGISAYTQLRFKCNANLCF